MKCYVEYKEPLEYVNKQASINFDKVDNLNLFDSTEEIFEVKDECFQTAKQTELTTLKQNKVYTEVLYTGQKLISQKWVYFKNIDNNVVAKARLVAKDFEEIYNEKILKDLPACSKEAIRIILALIAQKKMEIEHHLYQNYLLARRRN